MTITEQLRDDFKFAMNQTHELVNGSQILRYVAALNEDASVKEFVDVA